MKDLDTWSKIVNTILSLGAISAALFGIMKLAKSIKSKIKSPFSFVDSIVSRIENVEVLPPIINEHNELLAKISDKLDNLVKDISEDKLERKRNNILQFHTDMMNDREISIERWQYMARMCKEYIDDGHNGDVLIYAKSIIKSFEKKVEK